MNKLTNQSNSTQDTEESEREDLQLRYEAARIAYNERSVWWHSLTDGHRRALLKGTLSMSEEAFQAGVLAGLKAKAQQ